MPKKLMLIILFVLVTGCGLYPTKPVRVQDFRDSSKPRKHLIVLISGRGATFDYFERQRWAEIANQYSTDYDFVAPYLHYGYYMSGEVLIRLHEDIIVPAKQQGYESISLAGISMGGLGCLLYSHKYPQEIDRLFLFSPFLGKDDVQDQIRAAGGLDKWKLQDENADDWNYYIWQRLQDILTNADSKQKIFLGYGDKDRLNGHDLLATAMPAQHVIRLTGNHDDVTFTKLWQAMLEQGFLKR